MALLTEREVSQVQVLQRIQKEYKYGVVILVDEIVPIPTSWLCYDGVRGWGTQYPDVANPQQYVGIPLPKDVDLRWRAIRRAPKESECCCGTCLHSLADPLSSSVDCPDSRCPYGLVCL